MRYLVYLLLVANLGYFAWNWFQPSASPLEVRPAPVPPDVHQLVLLSERSTVAAKGAPGEPNEPAAQVRSEPVAAMEPVAGVQAEPQVQQAAQAAPTVPEAVAAPAENICQTLGPFLKKHDVTAVFALLARNGYQVNVRDSDTRVPNGYWVYLPAMQASQARRIVADLDAHGMTDYFIGKQNYISLGIFSDKDKAERRLQEVKRLGYAPKLDQRYRTRDVYWLDVDGRGTRLLGSEVWEQIQSQHADVRAQRVSCE